MIKINLLARRKRKGRGDRGAQELVLGVLFLVAASVLVYLLVHRPTQAEIEDIEARNQTIAAQNRAIKTKLKDEKTIQAAVENLENKKAAYAELQTLRATPAYMMRELSRIMTPNRLPTMTVEMAREVEGGSRHRKLSSEWDPKHVWISSFNETAGRFTLQGGAQSDGDVTQLAKRLEASVYFRNVVSKGGNEVEDKNSGVTFFNFTIVGQVVY